MTGSWITNVDQVRPRRKSLRGLIFYDKNSLCHKKYVLLTEDVFWGNYKYNESVDVVL